MLKLSAPTQLLDTVYEAILDAICNGTLAPEVRITQEGLAETLGVSRQPILQAIHLLKRQGFIADAGRKGVMVTPLDPKKLIDLYQIRAALDALAARQAANRFQHTPDAIEAAAGHALIATGRQAILGQSMDDLILADMNFHQFIYSASGNGMITETTTLHWQHIRRAMGAILSNNIRPRERVWDEHEAILDAILLGNAGLAETLARSHAETAAERLAAVLTSAEYAAMRQLAQTA
ncbi:GntR family transcriptional regulator [Herbaspirillum lusitanum]|uniref:GntR family transcriptional regulator n=1 Tax=Herbaspirillum lusitanum TaxID=213312 RepID=A0ABW9ACC7_9BURK